MPRRCPRVKFTISLLSPERQSAAPAWWFLTPASGHDVTVGATLVVATVFSGLMLSPDLDLESGPYHRWGPLRYLWWPYKSVIPHRSPLSHSLVVGPTLRIVYFLFMVWVFFRSRRPFFSIISGIAHLDRNALTEPLRRRLRRSFWRAHPVALRNVRHRHPGRSRAACRRRPCRQRLQAEASSPAPPVSIADTRLACAGYRCAVRNPRLWTFGRVSFG